jgi:ribokinase
VVFGSINTDMVISTNRMPENGETIKGYGFFTSSGGKGANQAVASARLGADVTMIGCLGNDPFGKKALLSLQSNQVNTAYVRMLDGIPSGMAVIIKSSGDNRIILDAGANGYTTAEQLQSYIDDNDVSDVIFITQLENNLNEITKALALAKENGMYTIFNPAPAMPLEPSIYKYVDILILNQTETQILSGIYPENGFDCSRVYDIFSILGVKNLIITLGKAGSVIIEPNQMRAIKGIIVNAVDTIGAGDAYIGAIAYGLSKGLGIYDSASLGNQVAAITCTRSGAQEAMPTLEEVKNKNLQGAIK